MQELVNGGTLCEVVDSGMLRSRHGGIRIKRVMSLLEGITLGMEHLHKKRICHGDLSPNNILCHVRAPLNLHRFYCSPVSGCPLKSFLGLLSMLQDCCDSD